MHESKAIFSFLICVLYVMLSSCASKRPQTHNEKAIVFDTNSNGSMYKRLLPINNNNPSYSHIEIYCWCFNSAKAIRGSNGTIHLPVSICTTPIRMDQLELIKPIRLFISISDSLKVERLKRLFFNNISESTITTNVGSARFVALFKENDSFCDTLLYSNDAEFIYNRNHLYKYSFNIMDSLKRILEVEEINCKS